MKKKKGLALEDLKVKSFITSVSDGKDVTIKGGNTFTPAIIIAGEISNYLGCNTGNNCTGTELNCTCKYCGADQ